MLTTVHKPVQKRQKRQKNEDKKAYCDKTKKHIVINLQQLFLAEIHITSQLDEETDITLANNEKNQVQLYKNKHNLNFPAVKLNQTSVYSII